LARVVVFVVMALSPGLSCIFSCTQSHSMWECNQLNKIIILI